MDAAKTLDAQELATRGERILNNLAAASANLEEVRVDLGDLETALGDERLGPVLTNVSKLKAELDLLTQDLRDQCACASDPKADQRKST
jgi:hypothetical protein